MNTKLIILVTGANRSGSTWVGKVIAKNTQIDMIIEPLNLNRIRRFGKIQINKWFLRIDDELEKHKAKEAYRLLYYYVSLNFPKFLFSPFEIYEGHNRIKSFRKRLRRARKPVKLLKDPFALFSIPWMVENFNVKPIVLIRHPAAFALSIKDKNWWFDFDNLLSQNHFFRGDLKNLKAEVMEYKESESEKSIIENAALLWKVIYAQVVIYQEKYPSWFYITHETLSVSPFEAYKKIFDYLNLEFTSEVENYITLSTNAFKKGEHMRNAKANAQKWKNKLSTFEKQQIYNITKDVSNQFYEPF